MYKVITEETTIGDKAVTNLYLNVIVDAIHEAGEVCSFHHGEDPLSKNDTLIFDECKVAFKYLLKGFKKNIVWVQGIVPEEAIMKGYSQLRYYVHSAIEYVVLRKSKLVIFCSEEMKSHYEKKYNIHFGSNYFIMPCFNEQGVDKNAFTNDEKYKKNSYVYVGGLQPWQCFNETLEVYKTIEEKSITPTFLYVYTADTEIAKTVIKRIGIKNYLVDYKDNDALGICLNNIKYGFVLRRDTEVNRVATPTKLSNYISHGVIPIYSNCLKSFNQYNISSNGPAIVCNPEQLKNGITSIMKSNRDAVEIEKIKSWCYQTYKTYYGMSSYISALSKIIERM